MLRVRLTKKLAAILNGVDVSTLREGDVIELPNASAHMLVAERWGELATEADALPVETSSRLTQLAS